MIRIVNFSGWKRTVDRNDAIPNLEHCHHRFHCQLISAELVQPTESLRLIYGMTWGKLASLSAGLIMSLMRNWFTANIKCFIHDFLIFKLDSKEECCQWMGKCVRAMNNWKSLIRVKGALEKGERHLHSSNLSVHWRNVGFEARSSSIAWQLAWEVFVCEFVFVLGYIVGIFIGADGLSSLHHFPNEARNRARLSLVSTKLLPRTKITNRMLRTSGVWCHATVDMKKIFVLHDSVWHNLWKFYSSPAHDEWLPWAWAASYFLWDFYHQSFLVFACKIASNGFVISKRN